MKVIIERSTFLKALGHVQSVVERRNTIPILSNVLLQAEGNCLALTATDLDIEIAEEVSATVEEQGAITASALTLYEIVRRLPEGAQVRLDTDGEGGRLKLTAGKSDFSLAVLPDQDFPSLSLDAGGTLFGMPSKHLKRLIDKTRFAMSQEETRYYLNGVYLHAVTDGTPTLRAVATDGHRLARLDCELPAGADAMPGVIVPRKAVTELRRLLDDAGEHVEISVSESKIRFNFDTVTLTTKLIDGTFPDYQRVIPQGNDKVVELDPKTFSSAIDRVSTISDGKSRAVKITFAGKTMTLSASSPDAGSATEDLEINGNDNIEIGFNARYLMDITSQIEGDGCRLTLADGASPTIIEDTSDHSALYVLMPLRV